MNEKDQQQPYISSSQSAMRDTWLANWGAGAWKIWRVKLATGGRFVNNGDNRGGELRRDINDL